MPKYSFLNDYSEGCHPDILTAMQESNLIQQMGYGADSLSEQAKDLLRYKINASNAKVHFVTGGTQANLICLASMLKPFEAIISASTGHIAVNESGAIEATGHKIITMPSTTGKLTVQDIEVALTQFSKPPHTVRPKVVYITNATELGTVYTKSELTEIYKYCQKHDLYLFMDGARLAMALASATNDMTLSDIANLTDMFWLGGTKNGALIGEAIIIKHDNLKCDFDYHVKQRGALLAKGRSIGVQFLTLLQDDLYLDLAKHANSLAKKLATAIQKMGYVLIAKTESNQVFAILPNDIICKLQDDFMFYEWERRETDTVVRLVTSWATDESQVDRFIKILSQ